VQDLASKVGGGEQQRSFSPDTSSSCSVMSWRVIVKKEPLTGLKFDRSDSSNSLQ